MSKIKKLIIIIFTIVIISVIGYFAYQYLVKKNLFVLTSITQKATDTVFIPNFSDIRNTVSRNNEKWVAAQVAIRIKNNKVTFFSQKDGLAADNTSDVMIHNNQVWFASQGGASKYLDNQNKFKSYLVGESNIYLSEDPYDKKLYASTFENFFVYNDNTDQWTQIKDPNIPINVRNMVFTTKNIFGSSYPYALPVTVYDKAQKQWIKSNIPEFGDQQLLTLFTAGERVFIYGRSKDYDNCGDYGKAPASIFFEYQNNQWLPVDLLNKTFYNTQPSIDKTKSHSNTIVFNSGISCNDHPNKPTQTTIDFSQNIQITSQTDMPVEDSDVNDHVKTMQEITQITGLKPFHKILSFENNTLLTEAHNSDGSLALTQITLNGQNYSEKELISNKDFGDINTISILGCPPSKTKYVSAENVSEYDGSGKNYQLYEIKEDVAKKLNKDTSSTPEIYLNLQACLKDNIYWVQNAGIMKAEIQEDKINIETIKDLKEFSGNSVNENLAKEGKLWFSFYNIKDKIFSFDLTNNNFDQYNIPLPMDELDLLDVTNDYFWFRYYLNPNSELVKIDRNGNAVQRYAISGSLRGFASLDANKFLISSDQQISILSDDNLGSIKPINDNLLPFYSKPTNFMRERSNFNFFADNGKILFAGGSGNFTISVTDLLK